MATDAIEEGFKIKNIDLSSYIDSNDVELLRYWLENLDCVQNLKMYKIMEDIDEEFTSEEIFMELIYSSNLKLYCQAFFYMCCKSKFYHYLQ